MIWQNKKFPNGCRHCGRNDTKHYGYGLCQRCYKDNDIRAAAKDNSLTEYEFSVPVESDEEKEIVTPTEILPPTSERRPGEFTVLDDNEKTFEPESESLLGKLLGGKKKPKVQKEPAPFTNEKRPKGAGRRVSTAETMGDLWAGLGGLAVRTGHAPLGRYLQWQGEAAGEMLDDAIAGTFVDRRLLQPAVKARGKLDTVVALFAPPAIILQLERNPNQAPMLIPVLKSAIRSSLPTMLPAMKKAQARETKVNDAIRDMFPDLPAGVDPVDEIISQLFFGYTFSDTQDTQESENASEPAI